MEVPTFFFLHLTRENTHSCSIEWKVQTGFDTWEQRQIKTEVVISSELVDGLGRYGRNRMNKFESIDDNYDEKAEQEDIRRIGKMLLKAFFPTETGQGFRHFFDYGLSQKEPFYLVISSHDPWLLNLPFELLTFEDTSIPLILQSDKFSILHTTTSPSHFFSDPSLKPEEPPIKILHISSLPENLPEDQQYLQVEKEQEEFFQAIVNSDHEGNFIINVLDEGNLEVLDNTIKDFKPHIIHLSGHGMFNRNDTYSVGVIIMEDEAGRTHEVSGKTLANILLGSSVQLVLINACESGRADETGIAGSLLRMAGVSVIGMRYPISDQGALWFASGFYQTLSETHSWVKSVQAGRIKIHQGVSEKPNTDEGLAEWFTPFIFASHFPQLFSKNSTTKPLKKSFHLRKFVKGFVGRRRYIAKLKYLIAQKEAIWLYGMAGVGKTTLLNKLVNTLEPTFQIIWIRGEVFPEELVNQIAILLGSIPSCQEDLEKIIKEEKIGVKKLHKVLKLAKENQIKILLLWDQAEEILNGDQKIKEDVNPSFIQILCQGTDLNLKVVFASRQKVKGIDISFIHLQNLSKPEVFRLINLGRKNSEHISLKEAEFLYEELGGHPHSLMLLIAFLKEQPSLDWNLLKNEIISIKSTVSAQDLLFPKIWDSLSYNEKQVLLICSLFDKPVWLFILVDIFPNLDVNILSILEILQEKSLGEFLKIRSTSNHPFDLLNENSLAKRAGDPAFFLHPLIRDFIFQNYLENGEKQAFHRIIAQVFTSWALKAKPYGTAVVSESNNTQIFKKFTRLEQDIKFMLEEEAVNHQLLGEDFVSYQNSVLKLSRALWEEMYLERAISILRQALEYPEIKVIASQVGYMLGIMYMDLEKYDLSEKYLKEALEEAHEKEDLISMSDAHSELALLYREQRDYERSTFHFQEYLKISHWLESEGYVTDLKKHLQGRARILTNYVAVLQETGKSQEAVNMIESAIAIYEYYGSTAKLYVHAQTTLATLFFSLEEWGKAEDAYYKALNRSEQIGLQNVEKILFGLGRIEERKANHVGALEFYEKALNGLKSKNLEQSDTANVIRRRIYGLLKLKGNGREVQRMQKALKAYESRYEDPFELLDKATILFEEGEYSEVEKILESVNTLIKGNLQPVILGNCQFQYGRLYRAVGQLGKSEIYFREALSTIQNLSFDDSSLLGIIWGEMGKLLMELNRFHEAKKSFEEALSFFSRLGMIGHEVQVLNDLSMVAYELDEFEGMVTYGLEAIHRAEVTGLKSLQLDANSHLGFLFTQSGLYQEALPYLETALSLASDLSSISQMAEIQLRIGRSYMEVKEYDKAMVAVNAADSLFDQLDQTFQKAQNQIIRGMIYIHSEKYGNLKEAAEVVKSASKVFLNQSREGYFANAMELLGMTYQRMDAHRLAVEVFAKVLTVIVKEKPTENAIPFINYLLNYFQTEKQEFAIIAAEIFTSWGKDNPVPAKSLISYIARNLFKQQIFLSASILFGSAASIAQHINDFHLLGGMLNDKAMALRSLGDIPTATSTLKEALIAFKKTGSAEGINGTFLNLITTTISNNDIDLAQKYVLEMEDFQVKSGFQYQLYAAMKQLVDHLYLAKKYQESLQFSLKLKNLVAKIELSQEDQGYPSLVTGVLYEAMENYPAALEQFYPLSEFTLKTHQYAWASMIFTSIGHCLKKQNKIEEAISAYQKAEEIAYSYQLIRQEGEAKNNLGVCFHLLNQNEKAKVYFKKSEQLFLSINYEEGLQFAQSWLEWLDNQKES